MNKVIFFKILIVALTNVLALTKFSKNDFKKDRQNVHFEILMNNI
ncbi:hypothetical protein [Flavobacterium sp. KACC 22761]|nr:hypothetical protein [Flavobacterium sp. KACC 22761]WPO78108.1 hypothetical protein SCB73_17710 [Flavobacterium sp. KACC 22761]